MFEQHEHERSFWNEFAARHGRELARCVAGAVQRVGWRPDPGEIDELVQEVYCRILERRAPRGLSRWPAPQLWGYLQRIARSVVVDELRNRCAKKRGGMRRPGNEVGSPGAGFHALPERPSGPTPEERVLARDGAAALRQRVCELGGAEHGARNLRILELAAIEGYTALEISRRLAGGLTASSVHTVLHRLRRQLVVAPGPALAAAAGARRG